MRSKRILLLHIAICALFLACNGTMREKHFDVLSDIHETSVPHTASTKGSNVESDMPFSTWGEVSLAPEDNLIAVNFLSTSHGWVGSDRGALYETTDGGETWHPLNFKLPSDHYLTSLSLISDSLGWIAATKYSADTLKIEGNEGSILYTYDGGKNWQIQYTSNTIQINKVHFINEQEGWVCGRKIMERDTIQDELFVLHTTDRGSHWIDISKKINDLVSDREGRVQDFATDLYAVEPAKATILTLRGKILNTSNGGESWKMIGAIPNEPSQTFINRLGYTPNQHLWVLGGTNGREGMWGVLAEKNYDLWKKYRTKARLSAAIYLSNSQVLAAGSMPSASAKSAQDDNGQDGVILYTNDSGTNWAIIYRNTQVQNINDITAVDSNIWAVGRNGLILHLALPLQKTLTSTNK